MDKGFACWNSGEIDLMADDYVDDAGVDTTTAPRTAAATRDARSSSGTSTTSGDAWDRLRMEPLNVADVGAGRYVVEVRLTGKGRSSGIEVDQQMGFLYALREQDRKVTRVQMFPSKDAALEAAGLSE